MTDNTQYHCHTVFATEFRNSADVSQPNQGASIECLGAIKTSPADFVVTELGLDGKACTDRIDPTFDADILALDARERPKAVVPTDGTGTRDGNSKQLAQASALSAFLEVPPSETLARFLSPDQMQVLRAASTTCLQSQEVPTDGDASAGPQKVADKTWTLSFSPSENPSLFTRDFTRQRRAEVYCTIARVFPILKVNQVQAHSAAKSRQGTAAVASLTKSTFEEDVSDKKDSEDATSKEWGITFVRDDRFDEFAPLLADVDTVLDLLRFAKIPDDHRDILYRNKGK